jgi:hypothetical protein
MLQKEQQKAKKVVNTCIKNEDKGVTYDLSQVWRVSNSKRIDLRAVSGKVRGTRVSIFFSEESSSPRGMIHPGVDGIWIQHLSCCWIHH